MAMMVKSIEMINKRGIRKNSPKKAYIYFWRSHLSHQTQTNHTEMNVDKLFCKQATSSIDEIMTYEIISSNVRIVDVYERTI